MVKIYSKFEEIQSFLSISDEHFNLEDYINRNFFSAQEKVTILDKILNFINYFQMFKSIKPFMKSIYKCVQESLESKIETINDYDELLIKTTLFKLLQEFITYEKLSQREITLDYFKKSFENLQLQPLIINLGVMVKPIYSDLSYIKKMEEVEQVEVSYVLGNKDEREIKNRIDNWISMQKLNLDTQEVTRMHLMREFENMIKEYSIYIGSNQYLRLKNEVNEMLTLKFTLLSLMESISDDIAPIPIK